MSQTSASSIYTGPWINWSHGPVSGATITLTERDGGLLTAFLAMFVSVAGAACWKITSYIIHQRRANQDLADGLHHQQQVILSNAGGPASALWDFVLLPWYWRNHAIRPFIRALPLALLALLNIAVFGVAGIFSSDVTKAAGKEVLIRSPNCGFLNLTGNVETVQSSAAFNDMDLNDTLAASTYSRACYTNTPNVLGCDQYVQQQLTWTSNQNATCPFSPDLCFYGATAAYEMDTGLLDTHEALGINAAKSDRLQYRKVTSCSPIHTKGYAISLNDTDPTEVAYGDLLLQFFYGPTNVANFTYEYNTHTSVDNVENYIIESQFSFAGSTGAWIPIPALNRTDADITLFLLSANSILYEAPNADPFFAASTPYPLPTDSGTNLTYYAPDRLVNALACADQQQFCNPNNGKCTPLSGSTPLPDNMFALGLNNVQAATFGTMELTLTFLSTYDSVHSRGGNALRASETLDEGIQIQLPDNQWMTEVSTWFAVSMAKLQQRVVQYATGPSYIPDGLALVGPLNKYEQRICNNHKLRSSSGTMSFSVLGIAIILIVGSALIFTSLVLSTVMGFIRQMFHWEVHKSLQWTLDNKLQLQRLAYEEAGQGQWSGGTDAVPITRKGDKLGMPQDVNGDHPRLSRVWKQDGRDENVTPEAEGLMNKQKGMHWRVDSVQA